MQRDDDITENLCAVSKVELVGPESKELACAASVLTMTCPAHPSKDYSPSFAWYCQMINIINTLIINLIHLEVQLSYCRL